MSAGIGIPTGADRSHPICVPGPHGDDMARLVKQLSIESPTRSLKECLFSFETPMPEVPARGARIKVRNAGVCYRLRSASSTASVRSVDSLRMGSPLHHSVRDTSLFPGYEVAGTVDAIGMEVPSDAGILKDDRVIVYPYEGHPPGYAEYISVPDIKYLVKVPDNLDLSVAAMLPSGALWAMNTVHCAQEHLDEVLREKGNQGTCKMLLVGTGALAMWAVHIAEYYWPNKKDRLEICVASLTDEGISRAHELQKAKVVQWSEDLYEEQLVERTIDACGGYVDIVIDFSATSRSIRRALKCLAPHGVMLVSSEHADKFIERFKREAERENHKLLAIEFGTLEQLKDLVELVSSGEIETPPYEIFSVDRANEALFGIGKGIVKGRAILEFPEEEEEE